MFKKTYEITINENHMPTLKAAMEIAHVKRWYVTVRLDNGAVRAQCKTTEKQINTVIEKLNRYGVKAEMAA